jgi:oleate hydratase
VVEFRRYLRKFLYDVANLKSAPIGERTRYTQYESIILPVTEYLEKEGVDFRFNEIVVDVEMDVIDNPISVSKIKYQSPTGLDLHVAVKPNDLTFVTLGSIMSGAVKGTNTVPADVTSCVSRDSTWSLWSRLAQKNKIRKSIQLFNTYQGLNINDVHSDDEGF